MIRVRKEWMLHSFLRRQTKVKQLIGKHSPRRLFLILDVPNKLDSNNVHEGPRQYSVNVMNQAQKRLLQIRVLRLELQIANLLQAQLDNDGIGSNDALLNVAAQTLIQMLFGVILGHFRRNRGNFRLDEAHGGHDDTRKLICGFKYVPKCRFERNEFDSI
jgi:hypothetical protein